MKYRYLSIFLVLLIISIGAVSAQENTTSDDVIGIMQDDTILSSSEYAIDDSNYDTYFNSTTGKLLENSNISDGDTLKLGNVSDKLFTIDKNLMITSNSTDSVAINTTFVIENATGSTISDLTIKNDDSASAIKVISSDNVIIENNVIELSGSFDSDAFAIYADLADNLNVNANVISYVGKSNGTGINNAIRVAKSEGVAITDNEVEITVPAGDLDWVTGFGVSDGIVLINCGESIIGDNNITLNTTESVGNYPSVYAVHVGSSDDVRIVGNEIVASGNIDYLYGIKVDGGFFVVAENNITVSNELNYASGIEIAAPADVEIDDNEINVNAPNSAYGVYAADWAGVGCSVNITNNDIAAIANTAFDVSLFGVNESSIENNNFEAIGNYTTGIASNAKVLNVNDNVFDLISSDVGIPLGYDSLGINSVAISALSGNVTITSNNITSSLKSLRNGIIVNNSNVVITDNNIDVVDTGLDDSYAILVSNSNDVTVNNNNVTYAGQTNGTTVNNAMCIENSAVKEVNNNVFNITIPSVDVSWPEIPAGSGNYTRISYSSGVVFKNDTGLNFDDNTIYLNASDMISAYGADTVYVLDITDCNDSNVTNNKIDADGHTYIYGLIISGDNFNVGNNTVLIDSDSYYADGINVEGPAKGTVESNLIITNAPMGAYGIYSAMSNGNVTVDYKDNSIIADAYAAFGMELAGIESNVLNNDIFVEGNYTTGIATIVGSIFISENNITTEGNGMGNEYFWDDIGIDNVGIKTLNNEVFIMGNNIVSTENGIIASGATLTIDGNTINVKDTALDSSYGIYADNCNNVTVTQNDINYEGHTNGTTVNNALCIENSAVKEVNNNVFNITIPSVDVSWPEIPAGSGNYTRISYSSGVVFKNDTGLNFDDNTIYLNASDMISAYGADTVYVLDITDCNNANVTNNKIDAEGHSYIYGLIISGENLTVSNNDIISVSDSYYANAINVEGPSSGVFEDNVIAVSSPVVAYGIYSSMSGSDVNATYHNNIIRGEADIIYGMELAGTNETVTENTIELDGNKTMGIAGKSSTLNIANNEIKALGKNLGNTTLWESFEPETVGVKIIGGNATVYGNNIKSNGTSAVNVTTTNASVTYNYLISNESFGDASVYFDGNATVHDNLPDYDAFLETEDVIMYYKNGTRFTANLVNFYGEPLENMTITFTINGVDYNRTTNENGTASMAINLPSGEYEVITTFDPGYNKTPTVNSNSLTVLTTVFGDDLVKVYRNESQYYATFVDGQGNPLASGTEVKFNINGVWYNRKITENGTAKLNINLPQGEYIITAVNPENGEMHTNNITVLSSITDNADLVKYYKNDSQYVVTVLGSDGNPVGAGENVTFNINGVMYTRQTNASGQAKLNINLQPGNYTITAEYNGCKVSNNIEVLPVLRANDLVKKYGVSDQFIAYLVDGQGKPFEGQNVTFNINGVFYNRLTDSDGRAILNIKLGAAMDTYIITSSYNGSSISNKISIIP